MKKSVNMYILFFISLIFIISTISGQYMKEGFKEGKGGAAGGGGGNKGGGGGTKACTIL
jgi:hypothetical protein